MSADPTADTTDAQSQTAADSVDALEEAAERLSDLSEADVERMDDDTLATLREATKTVEDTAEDTRKDTVDEEITARDGVPGMTVVESHNKYVSGDEMSIVMSLVSRGIDPSPVIDVNATALSDLLADADGVAMDDAVGRYEYTYIRG
jgi:hypothetical protein